MKIFKADYVISAAGPDQYPRDGLPEIALAGRSNVGKSSLINKMFLRKNLARTSSQPGKTRLLNYYRVETEHHALYVVDVPGYGYAKVSKKMREQWGKTIESYLLERDPLKLVLLVVDLRHPPTRDDCAMYEWLDYYQIPFRVVLTKADKVPKGKWEKHKKIAGETLGCRDRDRMTLFSAETGEGREELWRKWIHAVEC